METINLEIISKNLDALRAFHQVAESSGFSSAALALGISKAQASKLVKRLEVSLRADLFHRTTRRLSLTQAGEALYQYSQRILELSREADKRVRDLNEGSSGVLRLTAPNSLGEFLFPKLLPEFRKALPAVNFELDLSNDHRDLVRDKFDFAVRASEQIHPDLVARNFGFLRDVVCATPGYVKKNKLGAKNPKELGRHFGCIVSSAEESWNNWVFRTADTEIKIEARGAISTNFYGSTLSICLAGLGIARLPLYLVQNHLASGRLIHCYSEFDLATHPIYLVYRRSEYQTQKHQIVRAILLKWFKENSELFST